MWDLLLIGARFLEFAGALVLLGSSLFQLYGNRALAAQPMPERRSWPLPVLVISALTAVVGTVLWVMAETVLFSGEAADGTNPAAVWLVFSETRFGRVCLWRIGLLLAAAACSRIAVRTKSFWYLQSALASVVVATFAWTGHGAMTPGAAGWLHLSGDILHLWAAGIWFGALVPLAILVISALGSRQDASATEALRALEKFSAIGVAVVAVLLVSGLVNSWFLLDLSNPGVSVASAYGRTLLVKLGFFALLLVLAAANRFWLTPRRQLQALRSSLLLESGLAVLVLLAVGVLGTLPPPGDGS